MCHLIVIFTYNYGSTSNLCFNYKLRVFRALHSLHPCTHYTVHPCTHYTACIPVHTTQCIPVHTTQCNPVHTTQPAPLYKLHSLHLCTHYTACMEYMKRPANTPGRHSTVLSKGFNNIQVERIKNKNHSRSN